jgi:hypothetical protein
MAEDNRNDNSRNERDDREGREHEHDNRPGRDVKPPRPHGMPTFGWCS